MGVSASKDSEEGPQMFGCCETRGKAPQFQTRVPSSTLCGVGMGLDSQLLAAGRGAVVTCLAKGGPAEANSVVQIGDSVIFVIYVDDLDVRELMNNPNNGKYDTSRGVSVVLANALLGDPGTTVRLGLVRAGESGIIYQDLRRAPLKPGCQWISTSSAAPA